MANLALLRDPDIPAEAQRYSDTDREQAYWVWRTTGGRSLRRTETITGVSRVTLGRWADAGEWTTRADREDTEDVGSIRHAVAAVITHELVPNIETAKEIRDNPKNSARDRLAAAQWLSGLAGVAPVSKVETAIRPIETTSNEQPTSAVDLTGKSPEELAVLEATYRKRKG